MTEYLSISATPVFSQIHHPSQHRQVYLAVSLDFMKENILPAPHSVLKTS